jgi:multiple sugar transport system permease protein
LTWQSRLWLFTLPSFVVLVAVLFYPLGYAVYLSVTDYYLGSDTASFVGADNYVDLFGSEQFWSSLWTTLVIVLPAVALEFTLGFVLAYGLFRLARGSRAFMILNFIPHIITPVVAALFLRWIFVGRWGLLDATLATFNIFPPDWLGDPTWARLTVIVADAWKFTPFMMLVLYAGLQTLDESLLDAAAIDGARGWSLVWYVILPALRPLILFVLVIRTMDAFRFFDTIYVMTGGGPGTATETLNILTYRLAFGLLQISKAAALAIISLFVVGLLILGIIMMLYRRERGAF